MFEKGQGQKTSGTVDSTRIEGGTRQRSEGSKVDLMLVWGSDGQEWVDAEDLLFSLHDGRRWGREARNGVFFVKVVQ